MKEYVKVGVRMQQITIPDGCTQLKEGEVVRLGDIVISRLLEPQIITNTTYYLLDRPYFANDGIPVYRKIVEEVRKPLIDLRDYDKVPENKESTCCDGCVFHDSAERCPKDRTCAEENIIYVKKVAQPIKLVPPVGMNAIVQARSDSIIHTPTVTLFPDTDEGNKAATEMFREIVKDAGHTWSNLYLTSGHVKDERYTYFVKCTTITAIQKPVVEERIITQVIKDAQGKDWGVLMARGTCGKNYSIGWSLCNRKAGDKFNLEYGTKQAKLRTYKWAEIPEPIWEKYWEFCKRAERYFKTTLRKF